MSKWSAEFESRSWDLRAKFAADPKHADPKIKLIVVDQKSLDYYDQEQDIHWPWPRAMYVPVIKFLEKAGARGVAFDMLYSESSSNGVEDDQSFGEALHASIATVSALSFRDHEYPVATERIQLFKDSQSDLAKENKMLQFLRSRPNNPDLPSAILPIPEILKNSGWLGAVNAAPDSDGVFRSYRPGGIVFGSYVLGLPLALFAAAAPEKANQIDLQSILSAEGKLHIKFNGPSKTYKAESIQNVIASYLQLQQGESPNLPLQNYKDAFVFVGLQAPALGDIRPTPLDARSYGIEVNANLLDNLLHSDFVRPLSKELNATIGGIFSVLVGGFSLFLSSLWLQVIAVISLYSIFILAAFNLALHGFWVSMIAPLLGATAAALMAYGYQYATEGRQRRFITSAFMHYVSPSVIDQIVADPSALSLGGAKRELTIFFSDIEAFTTLSEEMEASDLALLLNQYLSAMTDIILESGGTLGKYSGDGILAFWNAPLAVPDHPKRAVQAALSCQEKLRELNHSFQGQFGKELRMRIGIHTGVVSVGNFGSKDRFDYTVIGDAVNFAARLEGVNKVFGSSTLISAETCKALNGELRSLKIGEVQVVGKNQSVVVFEPFSKRDFDNNQDLILSLEKALALFEKGELQAALASFQKIQSPVAEAYFKRIEAELNSVVRVNWSPIWALTSK